MKRTMVIALFALSTLGTATLVQAQVQSLRATVPFEFSVGDQLLPADHYTITSNQHGVIEIQSADKKRVAMSIALTNAQEPGGPSELVFAKYGDQYFLRRIDCPTAGRMNVRLPQSRQEKRVRSREIAMGQPQQILVAAL